jgi:hypothetical protein
VKNTYCDKKIFSSGWLLPVCKKIDFGGMKGVREIRDKKMLRVLCQDLPVSNICPYVLISSRF